MSNRSSDRKIKAAVNNKRSNMGILKSALLIFIVTALIIGVIIFISYFYSNEKANNSNDNLNNMSANSGFPISFSSAILDADVTESSIYVLSKNSLTYFNLSGKNDKQSILNYSEPAMKTANKYALIYDRQGSGFSLFKKDKLILSSDSIDKEQINTAYVCDNGNFLLVTRSNKATSMLTYYKKNGEIIFQWLCANEYIVSASVSGNNGRISCAGINAASGEILTHVYYFDIKNSENNRDYTFNNTTAVDCFFSGNRTIIAVCNDRRICIECNKDAVTPVQTEFGSSLFKRANDYNGDSAIIVKKSDLPDEYKLIVYDNQNNISFESDIPDTVKDVACVSGRVYLLTESSVIRADKNYEVVASVSASYIAITAGSRKIYYYSASMLNRS